MIFLSSPELRNVGRKILIDLVVVFSDGGGSGELPAVLG